MKSFHLAFWGKHPALCLSISSLLGLFLSLEQAVIPAIGWLLYHIILSWKKALFQATCLLVIATYGYALHFTKPLPEQGRALFSIQSVQSHASPFQTGYLYKGRIKAFDSKSGTWTGSLPCRIIYQKKELNRPKAHCDYILTGTLIQQDSFDYAFKPKTWEPVPHTWSLAELRKTTKQSLRSFLSKFIENPKAVLFLSALFTGEIEDRALRFEFGRVGLQHLLAISGFHFAILSSFVLFFSKMILPIRMRSWILLIALIAYFAFVGDSPAVQRSFLAAMLILIGRLAGRRPLGLNILGLCLLIEIVLDPLAPYNLGFQLSFLSCFGILLLNPLLQQLLQRYFPKRPIESTANMGLAAQIAYIASSFFIRTFTLTLSVNLALIPLLFIHFHRFPLLSLFYNLIVPELTALSLILLLSSLVLYLYHPLFSIPVFKFTNILVSELLEFIGHPPASIDVNLFFTPPVWILAPYLSLLLFSVLYLKDRYKSAPSLH